MPHVAAVATVLNEADIIASSLDHLLHEGIASVWLAIGPCTDNTLEIVQSFGDYFGESLHIVADPSSVHYQPRWISALAREATSGGAEWILPFDADEFPVCHEFEDLETAFASQPAHAGKLYLPQVRHASWTISFPSVATLSKCAWRADPDRTILVANGNHNCDVSGDALAYAGMEIREICWRSFEHFVRKTRERTRTLDPTLPPGEGVHQTRYAGLNEEALWLEWCAYLSSNPAHYDPIPSKSPLVQAHTRTT